MPAMDIPAQYDTGVSQTDNLTRTVSVVVNITGLRPNDANYYFFAYGPNGQPNRSDSFSGGPDGTATTTYNFAAGPGAYRFEVYDSGFPSATMSATFDPIGPTPLIAPSTQEEEDLRPVNFTFNFGEPVLNVSAADFALSRKGVSASITSVSKLSSSVWRVRVATGKKGEKGLIAVSLRAGGVQDAAGNSAGAASSPPVKVINYHHMESSQRSDMMHPSTKMEMVDGGKGNDTVNYSRSTKAVNVDLTTGKGKGGHAEDDAYRNMEHVVGSRHNDTLRGSGGASKLDGGPGKDRYMFKTLADWAPAKRPRALNSPAGPTPAAADAGMPSVTMNVGDGILLPPDGNLAQPGNQPVTLSDNSGQAPPKPAEIQIKLDAQANQALAIWNAGRESVGVLMLYESDCSHLTQKQPEGSILTCGRPPM